MTGGAGFIGSALVRRLIAETDWTVINLDKLTYAGTLTSLADAAGSERHSFVHGDVADEALVSSLFASHRFDGVIHLAAETHVDRSIAGAQPFIQTNIVGVFVLLQASLTYWNGLGSSEKERFRFLHVSTDEVFGSLGPQGLFSESTPYDPRSPYAATKAAADHLVRAWGATYGLPVLISNCSNNYGPYQFPEKLIPLAILNALEGRPIPVYGTGDQIRDWLHVDDHADALQRIFEMGKPGDSYNVGSRNERTNLDVVRSICRQAAAPDLVRFVEDRPGHDRRYAIDPSKIERELAWRPKIAFDEGLAGTVDWYRNNEDWWRPLRQRYGGERLGLLGN